MRKRLIFKISIAVLIFILVALFATWYINKTQTEKWYQKEYSKIFDESMEASYPLLVNYANALYGKATAYQEIAQQAKDFSHDNAEYEEIFLQLNEQFNHTSYGNQILYWEMQYEWFIPSIPYGRLCNGSKLREKESLAFGKIEYSRQSLKNWDKYEPDSLIDICQNIKIIINESIRDLNRYKNTTEDLNAWKKIGPYDSYELHKEYKTRKNWPFTFLNNE